MTFLVIFCLIIAALFALVFFSKRRVGVAGLALAAGAMLASMWVGDVTPLIAQAGIVIVKPPLESVVTVVLTLLPAILVLFTGATYKSMVQRVIGSALFALFAVALLLPSIGASLVIDATGKPIFDFFTEYRTLLVTIGLVFSVLDIIFVKMPKPGKH